jgi:hypothetical protein
MRQSGAIFTRPISGGGALLRIYGKQVRNELGNYRYSLAVFGLEAAEGNERFKG